MSDDYAPPVDALITAGDPRGEPELDYKDAYNITDADIPELIRLLNDSELYWNGEDKVEVWASLHAWRALGQLRAEAAIPHLLAFLANPEFEDDDWSRTEIPEALAQIGPAALPTLAPFTATGPLYLR